MAALLNVDRADERPVRRQEGRRRMNVYVLEVNPRASRTVPFVAKATGVPVAKLAAKVMAGMTLAELGIDREPIPAHVSVKESVFPFRKFAGVDIVLGPEMRSTGEVMGISERFSIAFAKSQLAAGVVLPRAGQDLRQRRRAAQGADRRLARAAGGSWASSCWPPRHRRALEEAGIRSSASRRSPKGIPT
jgi:hypothetical protein